MAGPWHVRWLAVAVAAAVVVAPTAAQAAPKGSAKANAELMAKIGALAQEAQTRFETADFAGAIELWTQAYAALPDEAAYSKRRNVLAYQIGQACVEAYALDPQLVYLRKAERLFANYLESVSAKDKVTTTKVQGTLDELREKIAAAEAQEAAERQMAAEAVQEREHAEEAEASADTEGAAAREGAEREAQRSKRLTIAGGAVAGVGALFLGVMAYGLASGARVDREGAAAKADGVTDPARYQELLADGTTANRLAVATAVIGGALVVTGVGLVAAGIAGKRRASRELGVAPTWLRGGAGLVLQGRF